MSRTNTAWSPLKRGLIVFRCHRSPSKDDLQGGLIIAIRNPEALWLSGYEDRIIYDCRPGGVNRLGVLAEQWLASALAAAAEEGDAPYLRKTRSRSPLRPAQSWLPDQRPSRFAASTLANLSLTPLSAAVG